MASLFKQRLTKILDDAELPEEHTERIEAFAKIFGLKRHQVSTILNGKIPDDELLEKIAQEFEVKKDWLSGAENTTKNNKDKNNTDNKNNVAVSKDATKKTKATK